MSENAKKPRIRFKGFTDAWEQRKLGELVKEVNRTDAESSAPIMMITAENGFINQSERYAFNNAGESLKKYILLKKGELAYNHGASKIRPFGSCFALKTTESARIPFVYHCFSAENNIAEFLSIELNGHNVENQLRRIVSSGARMDGLLNISFEEYISVDLMLPKVEEQGQIANSFECLDKLITLHQRKYDKLVDVKKSLLEKMFPQGDENTPKIRFKGFTETWEQHKFSDIADTRRGLTYSPQDIVEKGVRVLRSSNIKEDVFVLSDDDVFVCKKAVNIEYVSNNDILITSANGSTRLVGKHAIIVGISNNSTVHGGFMLVATAKNPFFLNASMSSNWYTKFISLYVSGGNGAIGNLSKSDLDEQIVLCPSSREQDKVGKLFRNIDRLITLHQRKLEKLKNVKSALLEKMFV